MSITESTDVDHRQVGRAQRASKWATSIKKRCPPKTETFSQGGHHARTRIKHAQDERDITPTLGDGAGVHMPRIGCGLAGGKWSDVEPLIVDALSMRDVDVVVYGFKPSA